MNTRNWQVDIYNHASKVEDADDIAQSIYLILATIPGSDPLRPSFGSSVYRYLDKPVRDVAPNVVYEATAAIGRWEKRIEVTRCTVGISAADRMTITIEATLTGTGDALTVTTSL